MRTAVLAGALLVAAFAQARTYAAPHVFEQKGRVFAHFSDVRGGGTTLEDQGGKLGLHYDKIEMTAYPARNHGFFDVFTELGITIDEGGVHFADCAIVSPRDPQSGLPTGRRMSFFDVFFDAISFPPIDKTEDDAPPFVFRAGWSGREVTRLENRPDGTRARSGWISGDPDFDLLFDGVPVRAGISTSRSNIRSRSVVSPDGVVSYEWDFDSLSFILPYIEAQPFLKAYRERGSGLPTGQRMRYLIKDGNTPVIGFESDVEVIGFEDAGFFPFDGYPSLVRVTVAGKGKELKGHVTLIK